LRLAVIEDDDIDSIAPRFRDWKAWLIGKWSTEQYVSRHEQDEDEVKEMIDIIFFDLDKAANSNLEKLEEAKDDMPSYRYEMIVGRWKQILEMTRTARLVY